MNISLEDVCHEDALKRREQFHFAMNGKSFAVIEEHFPDMLHKVYSHCNDLKCAVSGPSIPAMCVSCITADAAWDGFC